MILHIEAFLQKNRHITLIAGILFALFVVTGIAVAPDFGITWDEVSMRRIGVLTMSYVMDGNPQLLSLPERTYGPLFEMILASGEAVLNLRTMHDVTVMRHMLTFFLFAGGVWVFYLLGSKLRKNKVLGLLGAACLVLSPRIFEDSFVNSKDIPTLALTIISIHALVRWMEKPTYGRAIWVGCATALAIDVRLVSVILPCFLLLMSALMLMEKRKKRETDSASLFSQTIVALITCSFTVILFWPFLWTNPIGNFLLSLQTMSQFPWHGTVFYMDHLLSDTERPWHYIPVWIAVTTPLIITIFGVIGMTVSIGHLKTGITSSINRERLLVLSWCLLPLFMVIALHSTLYDGWRHLYFIYPAFILLALEGVAWLFEKEKKITATIIRLRTMQATGAIIVLSLLTTLFWMIRHHPFENVYFSVPGIAGSFEQDYWGASYKQGLEWIAANDTGIEIPVGFHNLPGEMNLWMLSKNDESRFKPTPQNAKYFLTNYRDHYHESVEGKEVYVVTINGEKIMGVYEQ